MPKHSLFTAHGKKSVRAHGTVKSVHMHDDGKTACITVRHTPPKPPQRPGQGFGMYADDPETRATIPAAAAKRFAPGAPVAVHIGPASELPDDPAEEAAEGGGVNPTTTSTKAPTSAKIGAAIRKATGRGKA